MHGSDLVKGHLGLSHCRGNRNNAHFGTLALKGLNRLGAKTLAIAVNHQCTRVMRRNGKHAGDAGIVPPEVSISLGLETLKQTHLGSRQHTESDKRHPGVMQFPKRCINGLAQLHARRCHTLLFQRFMIVFIDSA